MRRFFFVAALTETHSEIISNSVIKSNDDSCNVNKVYGSTAGRDVREFRYMTLPGNDFMARW